MKLTLILCSVMLALVVIGPELVAARAKPKVADLDKEFGATVNVVYSKYV